MSQSISSDLAGAFPSVNTKGRGPECGHRTVLRSRSAGTCLSPGSSSSEHSWPRGPAEAVSVSGMSWAAAPAGPDRPPDPVPLNLCPYLPAWPPLPATSPGQGFLGSGAHLLVLGWGPPEAGRLGTVLSSPGRGGLNGAGAGAQRWPWWPTGGLWDATEVKPHCPQVPVLQPLSPLLARGVPLPPRAACLVPQRVPSFPRPAPGPPLKHPPRDRGLGPPSVPWAPAVPSHHRPLKADKNHLLGCAQVAGHQSEAKPLPRSPCLPPHAVFWTLPLWRRGIS